MSVRRLAEVQPPSFAFTPDNAAWADKQVAKYPEGRQASAVLSLLWRAQKQNDYWLPKPAIEEVARKLGMPYIRVLEVATFYTMFNLAPVGRYFIQMCGTTPCVLRGSNDIKAVLERRVGPQRHVTADGTFSWLEVECLGACCNAPMVQINDDYYEDLTAENFDKLLDDLAADRPVKIGSQTGRRTSEPVGGLTSLTTFYGKDGMSAPNLEPEAKPTQQVNGTAATPPAEAGEKRTTQEAVPEAPAMARHEQHHDESIGQPDRIRTGTRRSEPAVSDAQDEHKAAQAAVNGGETHEPSAKPGHEPAKDNGKS